MFIFIVLNNNNIKKELECGVWVPGNDLKHPNNKILFGFWLWKVQKHLTTKIHTNGDVTQNQTPYSHLNLCPIIYTIYVN